MRMITCAPSAAASALPSRRQLCGILIAQVKADDDAYSQVLWLDGVERKYIEEVGTMNVFFKIDGRW